MENRTLQGIPDALRASAGRLPRLVRTHTGKSLDGNCRNPLIFSVFLAHKIKKL